MVIACQAAAPVALGHHPLAAWLFTALWVLLLVEEHSGHDVRWAPYHWMPFASCPMGGGAAPHDIHHYKLCGRATYSLMHQWVVEAEHEAAPAQPQPGVDGPMDVADAEAEAPTPPHVRDMQTILTACAATFCPVCAERGDDGVTGQKDGACVHVTCNNGHRYCYYCMKPTGPCAGYSGPRCPGNRLPDGCPQYLTDNVSREHPLANGFVFTDCGQRSTQECVLAVASGARLHPSGCSARFPLTRVASRTTGLPCKRRA